MFLPRAFQAFVNVQSLINVYNVNKRDKKPLILNESLGGIPCEEVLTQNHEIIAKHNEKYLIVKLTIS